ncbi:hypothetical protein WJX73_002611 [Symbiochloris irregularis]|uniref:F-box domain-containing protein n=1 Tax=Symbiochloris irregularis TaxID=706552 RepID=A0AAW1P2V3_9CHLO
MNAVPPLSVHSMAEAKRQQAIDLPDSVWHLILEKLDFRSLLSCERVNRQLHRLLSKPGLWDEIDLTLEQLVENDNQDQGLRTPAVRWALARISRDTDRDSDGCFEKGTSLFLEGHASCIAESLSVPYFFSALDALQIDYALGIELSGYPLGLLHNINLEDGEQRRGHLDSGTARGIAQLWAGRLVDVTLLTPPESFYGSELELLDALPRLQSLTLSGADWDHAGPGNAVGLTDDLAFLRGKADLQSVRLFNHPRLSDITDLKDLATLDNLTLVCTGVTEMDPPRF